MRTKPTHLSTCQAVHGIWLTLLLIILFTAGACTTTAPPPPAKGAHSATFKAGVPGGVIVNTMTISARVKAIDTGNRRLMLLKPNGETVTIKVGPEAVNFDQIRKGDLVKATVTEETLVYIDEEGASTPDAAAGMVALAPKGALPGGLMAGTVRMTATVVAIDHAMRTARLEFEDGSIKTFPVRDDIDLSRHHVGEKVVFQITEMIAITVEAQ
jgi:hypothetical protein